MQFTLIHQDAVGAKTTAIRTISFLQLAKHLTFAGIDRKYFYAMPFRYLANFFDLFQNYDLIDGQIRPFWLLSSDPTERNYISNRLGRAVADHLSKSIYLARYTHSYECAMALAGFAITGKRPDFYCDTGNQQFSVEAKGYSTLSMSDKEMNGHKAQSKTGPLAVNFSVASVAYGLYQAPKVKYYDPPLEDVEYQRDLNFRLRANYYSAVLFFLTESGFFEPTATQEGRYRRFISRRLGSTIDILVDDDVFKLAWNEQDWNYEREQELNDADESFIDRDGIGVIMGYDRRQ